MVIEAQVSDTVAVPYARFDERIREALATGAELSVRETQCTRDYSYLFAEEIYGSMQTAKRSERYQHGQCEAFTFYTSARSSRHHAPRHALYYLIKG
jgi:hypothetical protein